MTEIGSRKFPANFIHWFSRHYMLVVNGILLIFILLTLAAPAAMKLGWDQAGKTLYHFLRNFCHQLAFRSWFQFGEQAYYPRYEITGMLSYEAMFGASPEDIATASSILGNTAAGYKVAVCQRDFAMYTAMLITGLVFVLTDKKLKRIPLWQWILLGVIPLGFDGLSQLSSTAGIFPTWFPARESTPLIRTITGGLFGLLSGWYIYPSLEIELSTARRNILRD